MIARRGLMALLALAVVTAARAEPYRPPRTAFGHPDLQGIWTAESATGLERRKAFKTLVATPAEAAAFLKRRADGYADNVAPVDPAAPAPSDGEVTQDAAQWYKPPAGLARIRGQARTSWIVDPADGKLPYTDASRAEAKQAAEADDHVFNDPEPRPFDERCVLGNGGSAGPPMLNAQTNALLQIVQTRGHVAIVAEMIHDVRIIRLGDRRHGPAALHPWMGDSVGWWEGDTLVVETTHFNPGERWHWNTGSYLLIAPNARVTERFTRTAPGEILYRYTVEDPAHYTRAWRGEMPLRASRGPIFEFACHEGNYVMANILGGTRAEERETPATTATAAASPP